jgi:hypothetical protein
LQRLLILLPVILSSSVVKGAADQPTRLAAATTEWLGVDVRAAGAAGAARRPAADVPRSAGSIDVGAVIDAMDHDEPVGIEDLVDDPVGTAAGRMEAGQLALEAPTDLVWVLHEGTEHELDDGRRGALWQPCELAFGRSSDLEVVDRGLGHFFR